MVTICLGCQYRLVIFAFFPLECIPSIEAELGILLNRNWDIEILVTELGHMDIAHKEIGMVTMHRMLILVGDFFGFVPFRMHPL